MAEHNTLTGASLHEPKGVAAATASQVYVSDGAGSGTWTDTQNVKGRYVVNAVIADVSTAETVYIPIPHAGTIDTMVTVLEGALTVADATVTLNNPGVGTVGSVTVAYTGSAAGDVDTLVASSNNTVTDSDYITVATDGGSTDAQRLWVSISINRT